MTPATWWFYPRSTVWAADAWGPPTQRRTRLFFWLSFGGFLTATFYLYVVTG